MRAGRIAVAASVVMALAGSARAAEDDDAATAVDEPVVADTQTEAAAPAAAASPSPAPARSVIQTYYPPPVDGPALRLPESPTRLYIDAAYAVSNDLSTLPYVVGSGTNFRFALGGVWRWHRFSFEGELPFANVTSLDLTAVPGGTPDPEKQTGTALGDLRVGAIWTERLAGEGLIAGIGFRTRLASHTTHFDFYIPTTGDQVSFVFPYYFHLEPTVILGGALGRFTYVINEGFLAMIGPNGVFVGQQVVVPTLMFWDSHVAVSYAPLDALGISVELGSDIQVNHVYDMQFQVNNLRSVWLAPAIQVHFGDWRVDAIARLGLNRQSDAFGVLEYVGKNSYTLRATLAFN